LFRKRIEQAKELLLYLNQIDNPEQYANTAGALLNVTLWYCDQSKAIVLNDKLHQAELNDSFALQSTLHEVQYCYAV